MASAIVQLVSAALWPAVVLAIALVYRKPITELLRSLRFKELSGFGLQAKFESGLEKAEVLTIPSPEEHKSIAASASPATANPPMALDEGPLRAEPDEVPGHRPEASGYNATGPETAVLQTWASLEAAIRLKHKENTGKEFSNSPLFLAAAARGLGFSDDEMAALRELQSIRNLVAHDPDARLSQTDAVRFTTVVKRLLARLAK